MSSYTVSAPGKLILCGEHAVVYGYPAIALPVHDIRAYAEASAAAPASGITFDAPDLGRSWRVADAPEDPLTLVAAALLAHLGHAMPDVQLHITADIPIASGMGSGAAIATVVVRALAGVLGHTLSPAEISTLVYESEKRYHGTPSGIDNTVVAFEQPIWFVRGAKSREPGTENQAPQAIPEMSQSPGPSITPIRIAAPFTLLVGDTGIRSATKLPVSAVRERWQADPARYDTYFEQISSCVSEVHDLLAAGSIVPVGALLIENQRLLREIGVSSPELDRLVDAALSAGALGAKLSGAGWGGVMIALVEDATAEHVTQAVLAAGAVRVLETRVERC